MLTVPNFDLSRVRSQMAKSHLISDDESKTAETEYRRFLALCKAAGRTQLVPPRVVDQFWHQHILNTQQYADDCAQFFGYFLHHVPSGADPRRRSDVALTLRIYEEQFGAPPLTMWNDTEMADCEDYV